MKVSDGTRFVGIDLGKRSYVLRVIDGNGKITGWTGKTTPEGRKELYSRLRQNDIIGVEAGNMSFIMTKEFKQLTGNSIYNLSTRKLFDIYLTDKKTDKEDALKLAKFLKNHDEEDLPVVLPPTEDQERQRKLMSEYASLQKERTKKVNRLHAVFEHSGFTNIKRSDLRTSNARNKNIMLLSENDRNEARRILRIIDILELQLTEIDEQMDKEVENNEYIQIAQSVSGVGKIVSLCFSAVVGPVERYQNASHLSSYIGFTPKIDCSSTIVRYGHISKHGNGYLRSLLVQAAWSMVRSKNGGALKEKYLEMTKNGKSKKKAVVAIARKLAELIYTLIKNKTLYEPRPYKKQNTNALDKIATEALQSSVA